MAELDARRAEVLGNAARIIQRQIRTYIARKGFVALRRAAIQLQSCWRAISACKLYGELQREAGSLKIQKNFRCHIAQKSYVAMQRSSVVVQTGMRAISARCEVSLLSENEATEKATKACAHADAKNMDFAKIPDEAKEEVEQLQEWIQRNDYVSTRHRTTIIQRTLDKGNILNGEINPTHDIVC